jgi:hypothetical protein
MSFLNKIFGTKKTNNRKELIASLEEVDFRSAAENIAFTFREGARKAKSEGKQFVVKKELLAAGERFMKNPHLESAVTLLEEKKMKGQLSIFHF